MKLKQALDACRREMKYQAMGTMKGSKIGPLHIPLLSGPVGIGKTAISKTLSEELALPRIGINSGEASDGTDVTGVPFPQNIEDSWVTTWAPNEQIYQATKEPVLLHFDDVDKASPPAQNALIGLLGEREFRGVKLHPGSLLLLSGNRIEDDMYANELSESMRTRITNIPLEPDAVTWAGWGKESGLIHPLLCAYVLYKPDHIHVMSDSGERHTTPRGYREASDQLFNEPEDVWREILSLKLGSSVAHDVWAYYQIYSRVDVDHVVKTGQPKAPDIQLSAAGKKTFDPNNADDIRKFHYAAVFAVSNALNDGRYQISKSACPGIPTFVEKMEAEFRIAFLVQLSTKVRAKISDTWADTGKLLVSSLIS